MSSKKQDSKKSGYQGYSNKTKGPKGDEEGMGYHVYDYGKANNQNQYNKTFEAVISFIGRNYKQPGNIITSLRNGERVDVPGVATPTYADDVAAGEAVEQKAAARAAKATNRALDLEYTEKVKARNKQIEQLEENVQSSYSLVWGQCTASMQAQIKTIATYEVRG